MTTSTKPPQAVLSELINGYWASCSIVAAAELGLAEDEARRFGPTTGFELARVLPAHPTAALIEARPM